MSKLLFHAQFPTLCDSTQLLLGWRLRVSKTPRSAPVYAKSLPAVLAFPACLVCEWVQVLPHTWCLHSHRPLFVRKGSVGSNLSIQPCFFLQNSYSPCCPALTEPQHVAVGSHSRGILALVNALPPPKSSHPPEQVCPAAQSSPGLIPRPIAPVWVETFFCKAIKPMSSCIRYTGQDNLREQEGGTLGPKETQTCRWNRKFIVKKALAP